MKTLSSCFAVGLLIVAACYVATINAQVGKSLGVVDANIAPEKDLLTFPHMTPAIVKGIVEKRPFNSITDLNAYLLSQGLKQEQAMEFYTKAFVHINLNTASRDEILLVPGAGNRMAREFAEYRPWKTWAQFDKEISKYVGQEATDKLKQYCFIPGESQHRHRCRHLKHSRRRFAHGSGVQGIPAMEDQSAVRQRNQ